MEKAKKFSDEVERLPAKLVFKAGKLKKKTMTNFKKNIIM